MGQEKFVSCAKSPSTKAAKIPTTPVQTLATAMTKGRSESETDTLARSKPRRSVHARFRKVLEAKMLCNRSRSWHRQA